MKPFWRFIRGNTNLTHLDLSNCLHETKQITHLIKSINKSLSLQSVHLNNIPILSKH